MRLPQSTSQPCSVNSVRYVLFRLSLALLLLALQPFAFASSQLTYSPAELVFGEVVVGQSVTLPVSMTNNGATSVTISGVSVGNSAFSAANVSLPLTLDAGQTAEFVVNFTPTADGWTGGPIRFSSEETVIGSLQVGGTGVSSAAVLATPGSLSFGSIAVGSSSTLPVVLTNTRSWNVNLVSLQSTGTGFSTSGPTFPMTLGPGQSVTLNVTFNPSSAGLDGGIVFIGGPKLTIALSGTGAQPGQLIANPATLAFGTVQTGSNATLTDALTNTGGSVVTINSASVGGPGFSVSGLSFPMTLNPGASVTYSVTFSPSSGSAATGTISVASNASDTTLNVGLSGTGAAQGQLTLAPTAVSFGNVAVGSTSTQTSSLTASGSSVTVSSASSSSSEFTLSGISFPATIAAGQSVPVTLTFAPQSTGSTSAVVALASNASNTASQSLTGTGITTSHSVSLAWNDSQSGISGYNVYRGNVSGGPYEQINTGLTTSTAYSDTNVVSGQTYYYVTTAVNSSGAESSYSNEAQGVIPTP
jgi:hypothetical protein